MIELGGMMIVACLFVEAFHFVREVIAQEKAGE